ncbi:hypothetical protein [Bacillus swezeyi]|uniref:Uncharacterized protein n=1 Tax=Bacillus swezeyi TaxID=1925020 RepID=A0A5M8RGE2_9BACI|nr:hypothetical protein [Bacillus swezeyi]KAA6446911.1 hypothetical protein DX927_22935 [Bacillus swezeyi]KAA6471479.1 hypothetical protein DX928_23175 [Bacillus swezeyi]
MKKTLLAIGDKNFSLILKNHLKKFPHKFELTETEVFHFKYLEEIIHDTKPDLLILHEYHLLPEKDITARNEIWFRFVKRMRERYENKLRIIFLCERDNDDSFLSSIVSLNVLDIFNHNAIDTDTLLKQMWDEPKFKNVAHFLSKPVDLKQYSSDSEVNSEETAAVHEGDHKNAVVNETSEEAKSPVKVQKIINKTTIKRNFKINIQKNKEVIVGVPIQNQLVLVGSPYKRVGSTFLSHLLARELAKGGITVTYIEDPFSSSYTFDRFIGHQKTDMYRSRFFQFNRSGENQFYKYSSSWEYEGVQLICKNPAHEDYQENDLSYESFLKVLMGTKSAVTILDVGASWHLNVYKELYEMANHVIYVIDPDISAIQHLEESEDSSSRFFRNTLKNSENTLLIGNRFTDEMMRHSVINELYEQKMISCVPDIPSDDVFDAQINGIFVNDTRTHRQLIKKAMDPVIDRILPKELTKHVRSGKGLFHSIFNRSVSVEKEDKTQEESK